MIYEEIMPVDKFGWHPTELQVREQVAAAQRAAGSNLRVVRIKFLEHHGSNPTHACGHWLVELDGYSHELATHLNKEKE